MRTIRFTDEDWEELGLRIVILSGPVEYTETKGIYRVPGYVCRILIAKEIPFEFVD